MIHVIRRMWGRNCSLNLDIGGLFSFGFTKQQQKFRREFAQCAPKSLIQKNYKDEQICFQERVVLAGFSQQVDFHTIAWVSSATKL